MSDFNAMTIFPVAVYKIRCLSNNCPYLLKVGAMPQPKNRLETRLQNLIANAKELNIQVRTEKLLREAGYRAHSGSCRLKGQDVIVIDRDAPIVDQIEFLASELAARHSAVKHQPDMPQPEVRE
jgi:hypothetical protein